MSNRERKLAGLQSQLNDLQNQLVRRESENTTQQQTIKMMQEKHRYSAGEVRIVVSYRIFAKKSVGSLGENSAKLLTRPSPVCNFHDATPISLIKSSEFYFHIG